MDPTLRSVPADRFLRIEAVLERARRLIGPEIRELVGSFRDEGRPGADEPSEGERRLARTRVLSVAVRRSGLAAEARTLRELSASAVSAAAGRQGSARPPDRLGLLFDAELAVTDATLAILLEDHLSREVAGWLRRPFDRAVSVAGPAGQGSPVAPVTVSPGASPTDDAHRSRRVHACRS